MLAVESVMVKMREARDRLARWPWKQKLAVALGLKALWLLFMPLGALGWLVFFWANRDPLVSRAAGWSLVWMFVSGLFTARAYFYATPEMPITEENLILILLAYVFGLLSAWQYGRVFQLLGLPLVRWLWFGGAFIPGFLVVVGPVLRIWLAVHLWRASSASLAQR